MLALFIDLRFFDVVDILLVAGLLYGLYYLLRGTAAINIFLGIVAVFLIWKIVSALQMELLIEILGAFVSVGFIALIIIFQPEIRQFLLALGTPPFIRKVQHRFSFLGFRLKDDELLYLDPVISACELLSKSKTGALIVLTRSNNLFQYVQTGIVLNAEISQTLLESIFFKNNPLHDGAVIIANNKIRAAGCILPVTKRLDLTARPGLRHRAGLGVTEQSDAISIIISEETGKISLALDGRLSLMRNIAALRNSLLAEFSDSETFNSTQKSE
jgi:diadenylate cyclase